MILIYHLDLINPMILDLLASYFNVRKLNCIQKNLFVCYIVLKYKFKLLQLKHCVCFKWLHHIFKIFKGTYQTTLLQNNIELKDNMTT
jgi:hypothetical protein